MRNESTNMRPTLISILAYGIIFLSISSCATVPTEPLASGELRLLSMHVPMTEEIRLNFPFVVNINFEADGTPEIRTACFYFSGDGPYCVKVGDVNYGSPGTIRVQLRAKISGSHALESYAFYVQDGKTKPTNTVGCQIRIIP
jgi:hypothetical protein